MAKRNSAHAQKRRVAAKPFSFREMMAKQKRIAALIVAADSAVKAGQVDLIEIRLGTGIGGKSFVTLTGDVGDVTASVNVGKETCAERAMLVESVVIPSPHKALTDHIL